ncbi:MAG: hypothetical protein R3C60_00945 [Parvularculaceae bacterium]
MASAAGCATTILPDNHSSNTDRTQQQNAINSAAAALDSTPWRKPDQSSLADRLGGVDPDTDGFTRADAVASYLTSLKAEKDQQQAILFDAQKNIDAANELVRLAYEACDGPGPQIADVATIEAAISSMRETRAIYLATLKEIDADVSALDAVESSFDSTATRLGVAADLLAGLAIRQSENITENNFQKSNFMRAF